MNKVHTISGLKEIFKDYDIFILDQWGVMHDGNKGYANAINCIEKLSEFNKNLIIISNSSGRKHSTEHNLPQLGFNLSFFSEIMTSGEMVWQSLLNEDRCETKNLGKNCLHIFDNSQNNNKKYLQDLNKYNSVSSVEEADFILACTPFINYNVSGFIPMIKLALHRDLLLICANPDFNTADNHFCMGAISELYRNIGGRTFELGKPNFEIYNRSLKKINNINKSKILAIGDSIHHDIKGANNFGIDSLLITSTGIHKDFFDNKKPNWENENNTLQKLEIKPTFLCSEFIF